MKGMFFDIKEFALNDGDGIRTTVFLKGCPLRCVWCHNPEGLSPDRELYIKQSGCLHCGLCRKPCDHEDCRGLGRCLHVCPKNLISAAGIERDSVEIAKELLSHADFFNETGGGVTLSGGEPLLQWEFCVSLLGELNGKVNTAVETSGFAEETAFQSVVSLCDFVYMDIKLADSDKHRQYTGAGNEKIIQNARWLKSSGIRHTFRTPLIPGITDTEENLTAISEIVGGSSWEKLPFNALAPVKYPCVDRIFQLNGIEKP